MVFDFGVSKYFDKDNNPVDASGRLLDPSEVLEPQLEPGHRFDQ